MILMLITIGLIIIGLTIHILDEIVCLDIPKWLERETPRYLPRETCAEFQIRINLINT